MAKGNILHDSFEQLAELGKTTAKQGAKQVGQTFSPLKLLEHASGKNQDVNDKEKEQIDELKKKKDASTPLDFDKLQKKYQNQDKLKTESLRNRLFQMVKREDEKSLERKKAEEQEKKRKEEYEKQEKKKQLAQQQQVQSAEIPQGKQRRSIFSPKKAAQRNVAETRPATGKQ